jgi:hypothetical protein
VQSNLLCMLLYLLYLSVAMSLQPGRNVELALGMLFFIAWHTFIICSSSVPDNATTTEELRARADGTTFLARVLYPALGNPGPT